jgi:hypothetical protein
MLSTLSSIGLMLFVPAGRLEYLIENDKRFCKSDADRYKVWPTNRDRSAFNEVMAAPYPVDYEVLTHQTARLVQSHRFFSEQARKWLTSEGKEQHHQRADAIERSVRELLQLVVIDLSVDENAQEIFETLNAPQSRTHRWQRNSSPLSDKRRLI